MTKGKVLIVDDEPQIGELVCQVLRMHGFDSRNVLTGREGVESAADWQPDALLLDVMLPDLNGFEVCRLVRSDPRNRAIGVLLLTSLQSHADRVRGFQAGADRFISKPFQPMELIRELCSVIQEYREHGKTGLRHKLELHCTVGAEIGRQVRDFLPHLLRATPLTPAEIQATGETLLRICRSLAGGTTADTAPVVACEIFRDRLEHTLQLEPTDAADDQRELIYEAFGFGESGAEGERLADAVQLAGDGTQIVLTRHFAPDGAAG